MPKPKSKPVAWKSLKHARGAATRVPTQIEQLSGDDPLRGRAETRAGRTGKPDVLHARASLLSGVDDWSAAAAILGLRALCRAAPGALTEATKGAVVAFAGSDTSALASFPPDWSVDDLAPIAGGEASERAFWSLYGGAREQRAPSRARSTPTGCRASWTENRETIRERRRSSIRSTQRSMPATSTMARDRTREGPRSANT